MVNIAELKPASQKVAQIKAKRALESYCIYDVNITPKLIFQEADGVDYLVAQVEFTGVCIINMDSLDVIFIEED